MLSQLACFYLVILKIKIKNNFETIIVNFAADIYERLHIFI